MKDSWGYWAAGAALVVWLLLAWFIGAWLHLQGSDLWVLRIGLAVIGITAISGFLWWFRSKRLSATAGSGEASQPAAPSQGADEVDLLIRDAESRLQSSRLGRGARIRSLPAIFLVGEAGSGKTSTVVHSGLEPELLAGQVFQDSSIVSTRAANLWFARQAVFVEAGGKLLSEPPRWARLVRRLAPGKLQSIVGRGAQALRAAVVCFDCGNFMKPGATEAIGATVRNLHTRLGEVSQLLGISFPVYVLFSKMDRLPFFSEYVRNLSNEEATQVLGVTLPIQSGYSTGVYAEQETIRLTAAFDDLFYSVSDKRLEFLPREHDAEKLPATYEFPREFRKLRTSVVQFLVDLCRPSQLRAGPFLRGFYFTGVRTVIQSAVAPAPVRPRPAAAPAFDATIAATRIFDVKQMQAERAFVGPAEVGETRKVPQWVFLPHLFNEVLLEDRAALGASGSSTKISFWRRFLLASAAALFLILSIVFIVSYRGNAELESEVLSAARGISPSESAGAQLPSTYALQRLEALRQSLERLTQYEREGAPWHLRWGLYVGGELYPEVRKTYFNRFHQLLFAQTQTALLEWLRRLPSVPEPKDEYGPAYETLKAYLITTSYHDKSTQMFLSPVLLKRWAEGRNVDLERMQFAQKQFDFYSEELKQANPFSSENDTLAIARARAYLNQFAGIERVYQSMLAEASNKNRSINFNRQFPGSAEVVFNSREIAGAYTKAGWDFMQNAIRNADRYFRGEQWVLGDQGSANIDRAKLEQQLRDRYNADFIAQWRLFLKSTSIVRYASIPDAAGKLYKLSSNQSPLLALFCLASQNTSGDSPEVTNAFQPVQSVVPPDCKDQYIKPANNNYVNALASLQTSLDQVAQSPAGNDAAAGQTLSNATNAKVATRQIAQNFRIDSEAHIEVTVQKLMEDPITNAESLLRSLGPAELNPKGRGLCTQLGRLMSKYPFNPNATVQATLQEVSGFFQPGTGALWTFYDANLKNMLIRQGPQYVAQPSGSMTLNPAFVRFFNQAAAFTDAVYPGGSPQPHLAYTLKSNPTEGLQAISLTIDGQTLTSSGGKPNSRQFVWPGAGVQGVVLSGKLGGQDVNLLTFDGLWAVFQFFASAERWQQAGSVYSLEWVPKTSNRPMTLSGGRPLTVRFDLDTGGAPLILQKGYLSSLRCVSNVAQ